MRLGLCFAAVLTVSEVLLPPSAAGQPLEGPRVAAAVALGVSDAEAVSLERQWAALTGPQRRRMLCAGTRGACRGVLGGLGVFRSIPDGVRDGGSGAVSRFLRGPSAVGLVRRGIVIRGPPCVAFRWQTDMLQSVSSMWALDHRCPVDQSPHPGQCNRKHAGIIDFRQQRRFVHPQLA